MTRRLEGQRAVVTGAGRGLGRAIAKALAEEGARVALCDRTHEELDRTFEWVGGEGAGASKHRFHLGLRSEVAGFAEEVLSSGRVDVLFNNAAVLPFTGIESVSSAEWDETLAVNLTAPFLLIRAFLPTMKGKRGGSIVNLSSRAGVQGFAREIAYCASKFGIEGLTQSLAAELEGRPVSVNSLTPGLRIKPTMMTDEEESRLGRGEKTWEEPARLAPAFVYLAGARGRPTGKRFDALRLSEAIVTEGYSLSDSTLEEISE